VHLRSVDLDQLWYLPPWAAGRYGLAGHEYRIWMDGASYVVSSTGRLVDPLPAMAPHHAEDARTAYTDAVPVRSHVLRIEDCQADLDRSQEARPRHG
jgi:hypothetical protein